MKLVEIVEGLGCHVDHTFGHRVEHAIDSATTEREILPFFKENFILLQKAFARSWNYTAVGWEFQLGSDYRPDFIVLTANSGAWEAHLIEFESPSATLYMQKGGPHENLRAAQNPIVDWKTWIDKQPGYLRQLLSQSVAGDVPALTSVGGRHRGAREALIDAGTHLSVCYHVVIGRRSSLTPDEVEQKERSSSSWGSPEIVTYDRFIDIAQRLASSTTEEQAEDSRMPAISRFFGIVIAMFYGDHNPPHFHVR